MKKIFLILSVLTVFCYAQEVTVVDTTWQKEAVGSLSFSQAHFDNWAQGGENMLAHQIDLGGKLIYNQEKYVITNTGKFAFGNTKIGDGESKKTIDEIRIESLLTYFLGWIADPYVSLKGETQIAPGYTYDGDTKTQVSGLMDPGYFMQSVGVQYSPLSDLSLRVGAAVKETVTKDFPAPYSDDPDTEEIEKMKVEPGAEAVIAYTKKLGENTLFNSKLELFNNFKGFDVTDVRWDNDLTAQIAKYINVKLNVKLFYDKDISSKRQLNQSLLLGVSYTFL